MCLVGLHFVDPGGVIAGELVYYQLGVTFDLQSGNARAPGN